MNLNKIAFWLLIIGGLNWFLFVFGYDVGRWLPDNVADLLYILVGLSAVYQVFSHRSM
jgi:uncharacterized membrane protein YuzA (DUF378 family)